MNPDSLYAPGMKPPGPTRLASEFQVDLVCSRTAGEPRLIESGGPFPGVFGVQGRDPDHLRGTWSFRCPCARLQIAPLPRDYHVLHRGARPESGGSAICGVLARIRDGIALSASFKPAKGMGGSVCQANLPGHWLDAAPTSTERARRKAALERLVVVRDGYRAYDGPAVLELIRRWEKPFAWKSVRDFGVLIHTEGGKLRPDSRLIRRLLTP